MSRKNCISPLHSFYSEDFIMQTSNFSLLWNMNRNKKRIHVDDTFILLTLNPLRLTLSRTKYKNVVCFTSWDQTQKFVSTIAKDPSNIREEWQNNIYNINYCKCDHVRRTTLLKISQLMFLCFCLLSCGFPF